MHQTSRMAQFTELRNLINRPYSLTALSAVFCRLPFSSLMSYIRPFNAWNQCMHICCAASSGCRTWLLGHWQARDNVRLTSLSLKTQSTQSASIHARQQIFADWQHIQQAVNKIACYQNISPQPIDTMAIIIQVADLSIVTRDVTKGALKWYKWTAMTESKCTLLLTIDVRLQDWLSYSGEAYILMLQLHHEDRCISGNTMKPTYSHVISLTCYLDCTALSLQANGQCANHYNTINSIPL